MQTENNEYSKCMCACMEGCLFRLTALPRILRSRWSSRCAGSWSPTASTPTCCRRTWTSSWCPVRAWPLSGPPCLDYRTTDSLWTAHEKLWNLLHHLHWKTPSHQPPLKRKCPGVPRLCRRRCLTNEMTTLHLMFQNHQIAMCSIYRTKARSSKKRTLPQWWIIQRDTSALPPLTLAIPKSICLWQRWTEILWKSYKKGLLHPCPLSLRLLDSDPPPQRSTNPPVQASSAQVLSSPARRLWALFKRRLMLWSHRHYYLPSRCQWRQKIIRATFNGAPVSISSCHLSHFVLPLMLPKCTTRRWKYGLSQFGIVTYQESSKFVTVTHCHQNLLYSVMCVRIFTIPYCKKCTCLN